jgi:hypothetical protein
MSSESCGRGLRVAAVHDEASPAWRAFYPGDLPEDWRLAYYGHYWKDLLIPSGAWEGFTADSGWIGELPDAMRLYFELPEGLSEAAGACARLVAALGPRLGGVLVPDPASLPAGAVSPDQLFVPVPDPPVPEGTVVAAAFRSPAAFVLVLEPRPDLGPSGWRALLESAHARLSDVGDIILFLRTGPQELETAETILRLTGLPWRHG